MKNFKPFGPSIGITRISQKLINKLNSEFDIKSSYKQTDYSSELASQIKNEVLISKKLVDKSLSKEIKKLVIDFLNKENIKNIKDIKIISLWVVRQFKGQYNPIHYHQCDISGVGYLKLPKSYGSTFQNNKTNNPNGQISFIHGVRIFNSSSSVNVKPEIGDFYLFPHYLMHTVYPFYGDDERRSISFNARIDDDVYNVYS